MVHPDLLNPITVHTFHVVWFLYWCGSKCGIYRATIDLDS